MRQLVLGAGRHGREIIYAKKKFNVNIRQIRKKAVSVVDLSFYFSILLNALTLTT